MKRGLDLHTLIYERREGWITRRKFVWDLLLHVGSLKPRGQR